MYKSLLIIALLLPACGDYDEPCVRGVKKPAESPTPQSPATPIFKPKDDIDGDDDRMWVPCKTEEEKEENEEVK